VRGVRHTLPEGRAGATLDESSARKTALEAVRARFGLGDGQIKEVSAKPAKQKARTDWTFTFTDTTIVQLPKGEPRIDVTIAGDEVTSVGRYIFVPEDWERAQRAASTRNLIVQIATGIIFGGLLLAAAIGGMIAWSRGEYAPRYFLAGTVLVLIVSLAGLANGWPAVIAALPTAAPLSIQLLGVVAIGAIGVTIVAALIGLAIGALPRPLARLGTLPERDAIQLGCAAGVVGAAAAVVAAIFRTPEWARLPVIEPLGTVLPFVDQALSPVSGFLTRMTIVMAALVALDRITASWTRRRALAVAAVAVIGFLSGGVPSGTNIGGWAIAGLVSAAALGIAYATLLRFDITLVPLALGVMTVIGALARGARGPFPGALLGSTLGALVLAVLAWLWFRALRRAAPPVIHPAI
jgi:hypothetical protein